MPFGAGVEIRIASHPHGVGELKMGQVKAAGIDYLLVLSQSRKRQKEADRRENLSASYISLSPIPASGGTPGYFGV